MLKPIPLFLLLLWICVYKKLLNRPKNLDRREFSAHREKFVV